MHIYIYIYIYIYNFCNECFLLLLFLLVLTMIRNLIIRHLFVKLWSTYFLAFIFFIYLPVCVCTCVCVYFDSCVYTSATKRVNRHVFALPYSVLWASLHVGAHYFFSQLSTFLTVFSMPYLEGYSADHSTL